MDRGAWQAIVHGFAKSQREVSTLHNLDVCLVTHFSLTLCKPMDYGLPGSSVHGGFPGKNAGVGCYALLLAIFPTQASNPGIPHCRPVLYQLSYPGSLNVS